MTPNIPRSPLTQGEHQSVYPAVLAGCSGRIDSVNGAGRGDPDRTDRCPGCERLYRLRGTQVIAFESPMPDRWLSGRYSRRLSDGDAEHRIRVLRCRHCAREHGRVWRPGDRPRHVPHGRDQDRASHLPLP